MATQKQRLLSAAETQATDVTRARTEAVRAALVYDRLLAAQGDGVAKAFLDAIEAGKGWDAALAGANPQVKAFVQAQTALDDALRSTDLGKYTADQQLATEADQRRAAAAGQGEAALRQAAAASRIATEAHGDEARASVLAAAEAKQEAAVRAEAWNSFAGQSALAVAANTKLAAAWDQGAAAAHQAGLEEKAHGLALKETTEASADYAATYQKYLGQLQREDQPGLTAQLAQENAQHRDGLALQQAELALVGATDEQRAVTLARLQAINDLKAKGIDLSKLDGSALEEANQYIALAEAVAQTNVALQRQKALWSEIGDFAGQEIDKLASDLTSAFGGGSGAALDFGKTAKAVLSDLFQEAEKLALINPLKSWLTGSSLPTASDLGGGGSAPTLELVKGADGVYRMASGGSSGIAGGDGGFSLSGISDSISNAYSGSWLQGVIGGGSGGAGLTGNQLAGLGDFSMPAADAATSSAPLSLAGSGGGGFMAGSGPYALAGMGASLIGNQIGGKAGGILSGAGQGASMGAMAGPWGAAAGAVIGGIVGAFTNSKKNTVDPLTEDVILWGGGDIHGTGVNKQSGQIASQIAALEDKYSLSFDSSLYGTSLGTIKQDGSDAPAMMTKILGLLHGSGMVDTALQHSSKADIQTVSSDLEFATNLQKASDALTGFRGGLDGVAAAAQKAVAATYASVAADKAKADSLGLGADYTRVTMGQISNQLQSLGDTAPASDAQKQLATLEGSIEALRQAARDAGSALDEGLVASVENTFKGNLAKTINDGVRASWLQLTDPLQATTEALSAQRAAALADATAVGADTSAINQLYDLEQQQATDQQKLARDQAAAGLLSMEAQISGDSVKQQMIQYDIDAEAKLEQARYDGVNNTIQLETDLAALRKRTLQQQIDNLISPLTGYQQEALTGASALPEDQRLAALQAQMAAALPNARQGDTTAIQTVATLASALRQAALQDYGAGAARDGLVAMVDQTVASLVNQLKSNLSGYAYGGISYGAQIAQVSEGPWNAEAHVPLPDGNTIPVTITGVPPLPMRANDGAADLSAVVTELRTLGGRVDQLRTAVVGVLGGMAGQDAANARALLAAVDDIADEIGRTRHQMVVNGS